MNEQLVTVWGPALQVLTQNAADDSSSADALQHIHGLRVGCCLTDQRSQISASSYTRAARQIGTGSCSLASHGIGNCESCCRHGFPQSCTQNSCVLTRVLHDPSAFTTMRSI